MCEIANAFNSEQRRRNLTTDGNHEKHEAHEITELPFRVVRVLRGYHFSAPKTEQLRSEEET